MKPLFHILGILTGSNRTWPARFIRAAILLSAFPSSWTNA